MSGEHERIAAALERAHECARAPRVEVASAGRGGARRVAIGDPQAPIERFFAVLATRGLLGTDGWLAPEVELVSLGDHFDWGGARDRRRAARSGLQLLSWLAAHPRDQVTLIAGNHDLGRVGELIAFDDESFDRAHHGAVAAYGAGSPDPGREAEFLARYPALPRAEVAARDFAAFTTAQRDLVMELLHARRLRMAAAADARTLLCHAGVTVDDLGVLGVAERDMGRAEVVAGALNHALDQAVERWRGSQEPGPLEIPHLHRPGDRDFGEGGGVLYHRPSHPAFERHPELFRGVNRRRFDPRRLPRGLIQVIGHIGDSKCRQLLGPWASHEPTPPGALRHLISDETSVYYGPGLPRRWGRATALMVFADGRMHHTDPADYELVDLDALPPE
jgi:hypothetical protein